VILFDLAFELTAGALCAAADRGRVANSADPRALGSFRAGLYWTAFFYVPAMVVFVRVWPDWSSHYLFDAASSPTAAALFAYADTALLFAACVAGFEIAARSIRRGQERSLFIALIAGWAALLALLFVVLAERSLTVTTTTDFLASDWPAFGPPWGDPKALLGGPLQWALIASGTWNVFPLALLLARLRRDAVRPVAGRVW
jgi:hypothetical protein